MDIPTERHDLTLEDIKTFFIQQRGYWRPWADTMLSASPRFLHQYARYAGYPARTGPLSERMVELIYVALDASSTHLFESGLHTHMRRALEVGATQAEIFGVLHLVAVQGIAAVGQAANIVDELAGPDDAEGSELDEALRERIARLGAAYAVPLDALARLDPAYVTVLLDFIEHGQPDKGLSPKEQSLIQTALHACFTGHNPTALRQTVASALTHGATKAELLQAVQLGAHLAVHGTALGATIYRQIEGFDDDVRHTS